MEEVPQYRTGFGTDGGMESFGFGRRCASRLCFFCFAAFFLPLDAGLGGGKGWRWI